ncbi:MAG: hypothetical protein JWO28_4 [Hyphomicrobiales bacterium]|nr:hypothetical protein [Hyphomicrobiales bacterium]
MKILYAALALCVVGALAATPILTKSFSSTQDGDLGDLSSMKSIVIETQDMVGKGNLVAAKSRITDFETAWDNAESDLRKRSQRKWNAVDEAADRALDAIRSNAAPESVRTALIALVAQLDNPGSAAVGGAKPAKSSRPVPCEELLQRVRDSKPKTPLDATGQAKLADLQSKGVERCNADDDARADAFFNEALKLMGQ